MSTKHSFKINDSVRYKHLRGVIERVHDYTPWLHVRFPNTKKAVILHFSEVELAK